LENFSTNFRSNEAVEWWKADHICGLWFVPPCKPPYIVVTDFAVSPYSWFGFTNAVRFRPLLNAYGVSVDIVPFFLGAARDGVGNPYSPPPKAKQPFASQDTETTARLLGLKTVQPKDFPILSLFVSLVTFVKWLN
jgi:2-hydroxychromene-2-carboxylate isomerase